MRRTQLILKKPAEILLLLLFLSFTHTIYGQNTRKDTLVIPSKQPDKYDQFYDSLEYKAKQKKLTGIFYDLLISQPDKATGKKTLSADYYKTMEGKIISKITIQPLNVFGPVFEDTTKRAVSFIEKTANSIHTKSNLNTIKKMVLFKVGDYLDPDQLYETERIIRDLPFIHDLRIIITQDSIYESFVNVHIVTKDRFSVGASGQVDGINSAALEIYNQNIFGIGHQISFRFVGHLSKQPYMGIETYYNIKNISGKFIDLNAGYLNTYRREGFTISFEKPFLTPSINWGYGISGLRLYRTDKIFENDPESFNMPIDLLFYNAWAGRSFQIKPGGLTNSQIILSAGFYNRTFYQRPAAEPEENQFFSNSRFCLAGLTFTQRRFIQDKLVYSYGVTEDIPKGFKNELVYGYDFNEFGNRHYTHILLSNGNILNKNNGYLYLAVAFGGFMKNRTFEQGLIQTDINYISRQFNAGRKRYRLFMKTNYLIGIRRFDIENLNLWFGEHIRGFSGKEAVGKQRLSFNLEYVLFLRKEFYKFNMALYGFTDMGIIGSNRYPVFTQNYYGGLGFGLRLHNENLVFKTFHIRLALYPLAPSDVSYVGFILQEQLKKKFYSFRPEAPQPLKFQ